MSYTVDAIVVDIASLKERIAKQDLSLLHGLDDDAEAIDEDLDDDGPTTLEHARRIVLGRAENEGSNAKYGYALQLICEAIGESQPNDQWSSMRSNWFDAVDAALKSAGCPLALTTALFYNGAPLALPRPDDFPGMGHLEPEQAAQLCSALQRVLPTLPSQPRAAVAQVVGWLEAARGVGLVTFYH